MIKQLSTWQFISDNLAENTPVLLLYVLESTGSSPGRQGFFMAVNAYGEMKGTIGGGIMEHKFAEMAKEQLGSNMPSLATPVLRKQFHDKSVARDQSGMICSGEQTILLYPLGPADRQVILNIIDSLQHNRNGTLHISPKGILFSPESPVKDFDFIFLAPDNWNYMEKTGYKHQLSIIGGGHCALALSRLVNTMDFYTRLYEDRHALATLAQNEFVHEKIIVPDYSRLGDYVKPGVNHYVVIMTVGYRTDDLALRALLGKEYAYIGLLGSVAKTKKLLETYRKEGISEQWLQRVQAPIGLQIGSETPEEIAVSIAADLIRKKNNKVC